MAWLAVIFLLSIVSEAIAEYCGGNFYCYAPYECCESTWYCCKDTNLFFNNQIRAKIWTLWYFWFFVILIMMSCFGGCGYHIRRLTMLSRDSSDLSERPVTVLGPVDQQRASSNSEGSIRQFHFIARNRPSVPLSQPASNLPPPYAEVISQPERYSINKVELPPYQGLTPPYFEHPREPPQPSLPMAQTMSYHCVPSHQWDPEPPSTMPNRVADNRVNRN